MQIIQINSDLFSQENALEIIVYYLATILACGPFY